MNKDKRRKRRKEKKRKQRQSVYNGKILEYKGLIKKAEKGLEELKEEQEKIKDINVEEIKEERKKLLDKEESGEITDNEKKRIKEITEQLSKVGGIKYTENVFNNIIQRANSEIKSLKENNL